MDRTWEVFAIKYAEFNNCVRSSNFLSEAGHDSEHPIDCFVWVLKSGSEILLVETGIDLDEAKRRSRPILREPQKALGALGVSPQISKRLLSPIVILIMLES